MTHHENAYFIDSHIITRPHSFGNPLSQIRSKHLRIPCLTAIPYLFAMASIASVKELFSTSILRNSFVAFLQ